MTKLYKLPQGIIAVTHSDAKMSLGLLDLLPGEKLAKHNRPVDEELVQIYGTSLYQLFDKDNKVFKEVELKEGEKVVIPARQFHIHSNPYKKRSITLWKFEGDITEIIQNIRDSFEEVEN